MECIKEKKGEFMKEKEMMTRMDMRKGPWSVEEDTILIDYVTTHGDRHWNSLARSSGLKRSGKSCRLRWLNYLRPNVRRGNITLQEQITILDLHSRWGNRWSKIAEHLPGRTDNEIKNYWRTRVSKQAKQLNCDVNSEMFRHTLRYVWIPLLLERLHPLSHNNPKHNPNPIQSETAFGLHSSGSGSGSGSGELWPNNTCDSSTSSSVKLQNIVSDSGQNDPGPFPSFNSEMFEYTCGDSMLESLWNDENIWALAPLSDDDQGILKDNFLA